MTILVLLLALLTPCWAAGPPNLLVVLTDDQRADTLDGMEMLSWLRGPKGVTFTRAYAATPLCCPSRASLLTGRYSRHTGVRTNTPPDGGYQVFDPSSTIATWLKAAGYTTALVGKYLNGVAAQPAPPGWDYWRVQFDFPTPAYTNFFVADNAGSITFYDQGEYSTDTLRDLALAFLQTAPEPWFLLFAPIAPHRHYVPAPRHVGLFAGLPPWRPPSYQEPDVSDKPSFIQALHGQQPEVSQDTIRQQQLETLEAVDEALAAFVWQLTVNQPGRLARTAVVYTSDNGLLWGEHWLYDRKIFSYEESARVPLVIRAPGTLSHTDDRLVSLVDLAPTLAAFAGVVPPTPADGQSLVPLLTGLPLPWRQDLLVEWIPDNVSFIPYGAVVSADGWKYIESQVDESGVSEELYHLSLDPHELVSQHANVEAAAQLALMRARLAALRAQ